MRGRGSASLPWLLMLLTMACGGAADPTVLPAARYGVEFATAECARIFSCCDANELSRWTFTDEAGCRQQAAMDAQASLDELLSAHFVTYDGKAARRCVDGIATVACADLLVVGRSLFGPSCSGVTRGAGKIGAPCEDLDVICESSNCEPLSGTCGPTRGCSVVCGAAEYCDMTAQTCAPRKPDGAACAGDAAECVFPLSCQSSGVCASLRPGGAACQSTSDCASNSCTAGACDAKLCDGL
jgi:hypothetical protein